MSYHEPPGSPYGQPPAGGPPGSHMQPQGGYPPGPTPQMVPIPVHNPRAISERNSAAVVLLSMFTCGIYYLYWMFSTSTELKEALQDEEINPTTDVLLTIVTCFLWSIYVEYRNAQKLYQAQLSRNPHVKNQTDMVLIMNIAALFVGATWLIATYIVQEELNKVARF